MKNLLNAFFILIIIMSQTAMAEDKSEVSDLLKNKLAAVINVIEREDLDKQTKQNRIVEIVQPIFDFPIMSKLALGRRYWPDLSEEDKDRFTDLFTKRLKVTYLSKIDIYTDEEIVFKAPLEVRRKIHVPTYMISKGREISILYKLYKSRSTWKIYDVEIQGVSIIRIFRSQFRESLRNGTMEELFAKLEKMD